MRRRPVTLTWLLALVVLGKSVLASLCFADGLARDALAAPAAAVEIPMSAAHDDDASCWHAGAGGCHCTCVHASALPAAAAVPIAMPGQALDQPSGAPPLRPFVVSAELRPPIA